MRLGVRLLMPRGRAEGGAVVCLVVGSAIVMVAAVLVLGLLQSISARADVVEGRAPYFVPSRASQMPMAVVRVIDIGDGEATIFELGPAQEQASIDPPPGVPRWPDPGEVWLSPAAASALASNPYLAALVHGEDVGRIERAGLRDPDEVVVVMGAAESQLAREVGAGRIEGFGIANQGGEVETSREMSGRSLRSLWLTASSTVLAGAAGLMTAVARVADGARRRRLAVLQLLGAPLRAVRAIAMSNAVCWSLVGSAVGITLAWPVSQALSNVGMFGVTWWPSRSFNPRVVVASLAGVAVVAAWGGARSVARDGWRARRRWAERPVSPVRVAPLLTGLVVLGGVLASQAERRHVDAATPPRVALLLVSAALLTCLGVALVAPLVANLLARGACRSPSTQVRVAGARVQHDVRETARCGLALVLLVVIAGVVLGAVHSIAWQSAAASFEARSVAIPTADDAGNRMPAAALDAALRADGSGPALVQRRSGRTEPLESVEHARRSDLGYVVAVRPERVADVAGAVERAWPDAPPLLTDRNLAGDRGTSLMSGTLLVAFGLAAVMAVFAIGVNLMSLQDARKAADVSLLTVGMSRRQLSAVRAWEVVLGAFPGPMLASVVALPLGVAVMHLDHTSIPVPLDLALIPGVCFVVLMAVAAAAAATSPRLGDGYRRAE